MTFYDVFLFQLGIVSNYVKLSIFVIHSSLFSAPLFSTFWNNMSVISAPRWASVIASNPFYTELGVVFPINRGLLSCNQLYLHHLHLHSHQNCNGNIQIKWVSQFFQIKNLGQYGTIQSGKSPISII